MSSHPMAAGTTETRPARAAGSATAWSMAILRRLGQRSRMRDSSPAIVRRALVISGCSSASISSSVVAPTTNMPAFQRYSPLAR